MVICIDCKEEFERDTEHYYEVRCPPCRERYTAWHEKEKKRVESIFTLENMKKRCQKYLDNPEDHYLCRFVRGLEDEEMEFIYKSGDVIVINRLHIDDLWEKQWDDCGLGSEMIFQLSDVIDLLNFFKEDSP